MSRTEKRRTIGLISAVLLLAGMVYLLCHPEYTESWDERVRQLAAWCLKLTKSKIVIVKEPAVPRRPSRTGATESESSPARPRKASAPLGVAMGASSAGEGEDDSDDTEDDDVSDEDPGPQVLPKPSRSVAEADTDDKLATSRKSTRNAQRCKELEQQIEGKRKSIAAVEKRIKTRTVKIKMHEACRDLHSEEYAGAPIGGKRHVKAVIGGGAVCDYHIHKIRERDPVTGRPMTVSHGCPWRTGGKRQDGIHQAISKLELDNKADYKRIDLWNQQIADLTEKLEQCRRMLRPRGARIAGKRRSR